MKSIYPTDSLLMKMTPRVDGASSRLYQSQTYEYTAPASNNSTLPEAKSMFNANFDANYLPRIKSRI